MCGSRLLSQHRNLTFNDDEVWVSTESSVADPGCLSWIPDPDFYPFRIPDLGSRSKNSNKREGENNSVVKPFFVATNFTKLKIILYFLNAEEKNLGQFSKNYKTFYPKLCH
jgi:hypothetical protein